MNRLRIALVLAVAAVLTSVGLTGCGAKMVRVETGERVVCTYGEILTDTVEAIDVPADEVDQYAVESKTITCDLHTGLEKQYAEAQAAIAAGDLETAKAKLAAIAAQDAAFRKAQEQLDAINAGKKPERDTDTSAPTGGGNSGGGSGTDSDPEPIGPVATLKPWVPDTLTGYTATPIIADVYTLTRQYNPRASAPTDALVIVVEQYADAASVKEAIAGWVGFDYSENESSSNVEGRTVRFGTDGNRFATAAWAEGNLLIAIEGSSKTRKPEALKSHLLSLVAEIVK